ncbi:hypothetical protein SSX86_032080 [Deinandra increscens subsp. villosa]|uniref:Uncharacterized protein n=1 Tax=Deinandra increscens subsp. villosa TaxID=3103831 RepID=A0AAP0C8D2_9ASTR
MTQSICSSTVIGQQFIAPHESNLIVNRYSGGDFVITDTENKIILTVKSCDTVFHRQRLLLDECERPIATLRAKNKTAHARWNVFRGESKAESDMIFSATTDHMIQNHIHVNVSLANKMSSGDDCDFYIKGNWLNGNCDIRKRDSSSSIAQMHEWLSPHKFKVKIDPNVDYAFVVALIAIVDGIESHGPTKVVALNVAKQFALAFAAKMIVLDILL